jgi:alpha-1,6-mannosyltransferase
MPNEDRRFWGPLDPPYAMILGLGGLSAVLYFFHFELGKFAGILFLGREIEEPIHQFLFEFGVLYLVYLGCVYLLIRREKMLGHSKGLAAMILGLAILFRVSLLPAAPALSSDIYRYLWDGRVQLNGFNPYRYPPNSEELSALRDREIHPRINRPDSRTIYPAGAQIFFGASRLVTGGSLRGLKAILVLVDVLTLLLLAKGLRMQGLPEERILIYAWNPLVIYEIAHSGHLESLTVFLIVSAFYLSGRGWKNSSVAVLASASAVKLYPGLLLPVLLEPGKRLKGAAIFFSVLLLFYLPYASAGSKILGFLPVYLTSPYESFNLGPKYFLMRVFPGLTDGLLTRGFLAILFACSLSFLFKEKTPGRMMRYGLTVLALQTVLMPTTLHPWYLLVMIPFLAFDPVPAWLIFPGLVGISYLKYTSPAEVMPTWVYYAEYAPLFLLLLAGWLRRHVLSPGLTPQDAGERADQFSDEREIRSYWEEEI